jgi:hypothetical protein
MDKEERRKECQRGYVVLALDENGLPLVIRLMGITADAGRDLNFLLVTKALRANRAGFFFHIISLKKKTAAGEAWMFKFNLVKEKFPSAEQQVEYMKVASDMKLLQPAPETMRLTQTNVLPEPIIEKQEITSGEVGKVEDVLGKQDQSPIPDIKF